MTMRRRWVMSFGMAAAMAATGFIAPSAQAQHVLRMAAAPDLSVSDQASRLEALGQYLEKRFKMRVKWVPITSDAFAIRALVNREADLVLLGGLAFVEASVFSGDQVTALVQREEDQKARSVFITGASTGIKKLQDLKGRSLSLGLKTSTSDFLMPYSALLSAKIKPDADLKQVSHAVTPDALVTAVATGKADAGALSLATWERLVADKRVDPAAVKVFFTTPVYTDHTWATLSDVPEGTQKAITAAFLAMEAVPGGKAVLAQQNAHRYSETKMASYAAVRATAQQLGLIR